MLLGYIPVHACTHSPQFGLTCSWGLYETGRRTDKKEETCCMQLCYMERLETTVALEWHVTSLSHTHVRAHADTQRDFSTNPSVNFTSHWGTAAETRLTQQCTVYLCVLGFKNRCKYISVIRYSIAKVDGQSNKKKLDKCRNQILKCFFFNPDFKKSGLNKVKVRVDIFSTASLSGFICSCVNACNKLQSPDMTTFTCKLSAIWRMYIIFRSSNIHSFSSMFVNLSTGMLQADIHQKIPLCYS